jgi:hypothetical protein
VDQPTSRPSRTLGRLTPTGLIHLDKFRSVGHVTVPRGLLRSVVHVAHVHETRHPQSVLADGHRVTPPLRTFLDLADHLSLADAVVLGDAAIRSGLVTRQALIDETAPASHRRGARVARRAAGLARERVDSPRETRLRLLLVSAGLPEPEVNVAIVTSDGQFIATPDLRYRRSRVAIEYDGRQHVEDRRQWGRDISRREGYDDAGWRVIVIRAEDFLRPWATVHKIWRILRERGEPGLPEELNRIPWLGPRALGAA